MPKLIVAGTEEDNDTCCVSFPLVDAQDRVTATPHTTLPVKADGEPCTSSSEPAAELSAATLPNNESHHTPMTKKKVRASRSARSIL